MLIGKRNLRGLGDGNAAYTGDANASYTPADFSLSAPAANPYSATTTTITGTAADYSLAPAGVAPSVGASTTLLDVNTPAPGTSLPNDILTGGNPNALVPLDISGSNAVTPTPNTFSNLLTSLTNAITKAPQQSQTTIANPVASPIYTYGTGVVAQYATLTSLGSNTMLYVSLGIAAVLVLLALRK